jgi:septum formation protein
MTEHELILASTSPWRRQLLESAGLNFRCVAPGIDERSVTMDDPVALVKELALQKASAVSARHPKAWVLGADQMLFDKDGVFGKPENPADHFERLQAMRGQAHTLVTGYCVIPGAGPAVIGVEHTELWVRPDLEDSELLAYVNSGEGSQCAGGYAIEGLGSFLFSRYEGDYTNILGLPIFRLMDVLRTSGWRFTGE